jgi:osmotically-inducible protein OsmY
VGAAALKTEDSDMAKIRTLVIGGAVGAALTYLFDPERGPERRDQLRGQVGSALARGKQELNRQMRQLRTGARVAVAELQAATDPGHEDDLTVLSRVESVLYAMPAFPRSSVEAEVVDGRLILRGDVESAELAREIVETASQVRSVTSVENLLRVRTESQR